jgi:hypothetical protein
MHEVSVYRADDPFIGYAICHSERSEKPLYFAGSAALQASCIDPFDCAQGRLFAQKPRSG